MVLKKVTYYQAIWSFEGMQRQIWTSFIAFVYPFLSKNFFATEMSNGIMSGKRIEFLCPVPKNSTNINGSSICNIRAGHHGKPAH